MLPTNLCSAGLLACRFDILPGSPHVRNDGVRSGERLGDIIRGEAGVTLIIVCSTADSIFMFHVEGVRPFFCVHLVFLFKTIFSIPDAVYVALFPIFNGQT